MTITEAYQELRRREQVIDGLGRDPTDDESAWLGEPFEWAAELPALTASDAAALILFRVGE